MPMIILSSGSTTLVSDDDYHYLNRWKWAEQKNGKRPQVRARLPRWVDSSRPTVLMHRVIADRMGLISLHDLSQEIDHTNRNSLDNRRENLRAATRSQNMANRYMRPVAGWKGVNFHKQTGKWHARVSIDRKTISLGIHTTAESAARAYDLAARQLFGEYACLNFP